MAYFEIQVEPDGTDSASLIDSDQWMIDSEQHLDIFIWNEADVPVDVTLVVAHSDLFWVLDPQDYGGTHQTPVYKGLTITNGDPLGSFVHIEKLQSNSVYPLRLTNPTPGAARLWLDADSCSLSTSGHGTNVFNGQRVYVMGHTPERF